MTDLQWRAEWLAEFIDDQSTVFRWALVEAATTGEVAEPAPGGREYVLGWDPAKYHDRSAVLVLDTTEEPWHVVALETVEGRDYALQIRRVAELARRYNRAIRESSDTGRSFSRSWRGEHDQTAMSLLASSGVRARILPPQRSHTSMW